MKDQAVKRYVIGNRVELIMYYKRKVVIFKEEYTHKNWDEWKHSHSGLLRQFFSC